MLYRKGFRVVMAEPYPGTQVLEPLPDVTPAPALAGEFRITVEGDEPGPEYFDTDNTGPDTLEGSATDTGPGDIADDALSAGMRVSEGLTEQVYADAPIDHEVPKKGRRMLGFKLGLMNIGFAMSGVSMKEGPSKEALEKYKDANGLHRFMMAMGSQPAHTFLLLTRLGGVVHGGMGMEHMDHLAATTAATHAVMHGTVTPPEGVHGIEAPSVIHATLTDHLESNQTSTASTNEHVPTSPTTESAHYATAEGVNGNLNHAPTEWVSNSDQYNLDVTPGANGSDHISITMSHYHGHQPLFAVVTGHNGQEIKIPLTEHRGPNGERIYSADIGKSHLATTLNGHGYDKIAIDRGDSSDKKVTTFSTAFGSDTKNVEAYAPPSGGGSGGNPGSGAGNGIPLTGGSGHHGLDVFAHGSYHGHKDYELEYNGGEVDVLLPKGDTTPIGFGLPDFNMEHGGHSVVKLPDNGFNSLHTGGHSIAGNIAAINKILRDKQLKIIKERPGVYEIEPITNNGVPIAAHSGHDLSRDETLAYVGVATAVVAGLVALGLFGRRRRSEHDEDDGHGHPIGHTTPDGHEDDGHGSAHDPHPAPSPMPPILVVPRRPAPRPAPEASRHPRRRLRLPLPRLRRRSKPAAARLDLGDRPAVAVPPASPEPYAGSYGSPPAEPDADRRPVYTWADSAPDDGGYRPYASDHMEPYEPDPPFVGGPAAPASSGPDRPDPESRPRPEATWRRIPRAESDSAAAEAPAEPSDPDADSGDEHFPRPSEWPSIPRRRQQPDADITSRPETSRDQTGLPLPPDPGDSDSDEGPQAPPPDAPGTDVSPEPEPNTSR